MEPLFRRHPRCVVYADKPTLEGWEGSEPGDQPFQEEYLDFLNKNGIEYDERYIW